MAKYKGSRRQRKSGIAAATSAWQKHHGGISIVEKSANLHENGVGDSDRREKAVIAAKTCYGGGISYQLEIIVAWHRRNINNQRGVTWRHGMAWRHRIGVTARSSALSKNGA